jgi:beta-hydroxylase
VAVQGAHYFTATAGMVTRPVVFMLPLLSIKGAILALYSASALYVHLRGRVRHSPLRQLTDHSTFLAPVNALLYLSSKVPSQPFLDPAQFPELRPLQDNWTAIRDEALALYEGGNIRRATGYNDVGFNSVFKSGWTRFYLSWYGETLPSARQACPRTLALLQGIPSIKAAMFAVLPPGATLQRHRDPYAGSLRYHLGLRTANDPACFIEVDGQRRHWRDGEPMMFDETYIHYAHNGTDVHRVILFCDIARPLNNPLARAVDRLMRRTMMQGAASANVEGERIGGVNRFYSRVVGIRLWGKQLKARNRHAYYALKWSVIALLAAVIVVV